MCPRGFVPYIRDSLHSVLHPSWITLRQNRELCVQAHNLHLYCDYLCQAIAYPVYCAHRFCVLCYCPQHLLNCFQHYLFLGEVYLDDDSLDNSSYDGLVVPDTSVTWSLRSDPHDVANQAHIVWPIIYVDFGTHRGWRYYHHLWNPDGLDCCCCCHCVTDSWMGFCPILSHTITRHFQITRKPRMSSWISASMLSEHGIVNIQTVASLSCLCPVNASWRGRIWLFPTYKLRRVHLRKLLSVWPSYFQRCSKDQVK